MHFGEHCLEGFGNLFFLGSRSVTLDFGKTDFEERFIFLSVLNTASFMLGLHLGQEMKMGLRGWGVGMAHWYLQGRLTQNEDYSVVLDQSRYMALIASRFPLNTTTQTLPKKTKPNMNHHYQLLLSLQRKIVQLICLKYNSWNKLMVFSTPLLLEC